ncbi:hypothetical protein [Methylobacterium trifolii]|uniref:hypothetical protein n=1 Tax=Methylobacterium trifolii TaxID=1003092 RepID=UPI001EDF4678|nr:hypothetical protein [Methylobacterium trifolii]
MAVQQPGRVLDGGGEGRDAGRRRRPKPYDGRDPRRDLDEKRRIGRLIGLVRDLALILALVLLTTLAAVYSRSALAFVAALGVNVGGLLYVRRKYRLADGAPARP